MKCVDSSSWTCVHANNPTQTTFTVLQWTRCVDDNNKWMTFTVEKNAEKRRAMIVLINVSWQLKHAHKFLIVHHNFAIKTHAAQPVPFFFFFFFFYFPGRKSNLHRGHRYKSHVLFHIYNVRICQFVLNSQYTAPRRARIASKCSNNTRMWMKWPRAFCCPPLHSQYIYLRQVISMQPK